MGAPGEKVGAPLWQRPCLGYVLEFSRKFQCLDDNFPELMDEHNDSQCRLIKLSRIKRTEYLTKN